MRSMEDAALISTCWPWPLPRQSVALACAAPPQVFPISAHVTSGDYSTGGNWVNGLPSSTIEAEIGTVKWWSGNSFRYLYLRYWHYWGWIGRRRWCRCLGLANPFRQCRHTHLYGGCWSAFSILANSGTGVVTVNAGTIADTGQAINCWCPQRQWNSHH